MLDRVSKIITIIAATVAIIVILIGGIAWAVRLDSEVGAVQSDVVELQNEVAELRQEVTEMRRDMDEVKENQRLILQALERLEAAFVNHSHDEDGRVVIPLTQR